MTLYATAEELTAAAPEHLVAHLTGTESPDETAITRALDDASSEIDGYIGSRYTLPLPTVPDVLRRICVDIALYRLMNLRALGDLEDARKRYEDAIRFLKDVIRGEVSLDFPENVSAPTEGTAFTPGSSIMRNLDY